MNVRESACFKSLELHRAALQPILARGNFSRAKSVIEIEGESAFLGFIHQQGLAPLWAASLDENAHNPFSSELTASLREARVASTAQYLLQGNVIQEARALLDDAEVPHAIFKGASIRERLYRTPALRPAVDIDILIPSELAKASLRKFVNAGYSVSARIENVSHEVTLVKGRSNIDLHWHILRPGRTRHDMTASLLSSRREFEHHWGLGDEESLFTLLIHPVFVCYSTTPAAKLVRMLDIHRFVSQPHLDWGRITSLLSGAGLKTAAWITLSWLEILAGQHPASEVRERLQPGPLRRRYLNLWLSRNLSTRLLHWPAVVQAGFTLPAHDRPDDVLRAVRVRRQASQRAEAELAQITRWGIE